MVRVVAVVQKGHISGAGGDLLAWREMMLACPPRVDEVINAPPGLVLRVSEVIHNPNEGHVSLVLVPLSGDDPVAAEALELSGFRVARARGA